MEWEAKECRGRLQELKFCSEGWKPHSRSLGSAEVHCLCLSPDARFYSTLRPYRSTLLITGVVHDRR